MASTDPIGFIVQQVPNAFRDRERLRRWLHRVAQDHGSRIDAVTFVLMDEKSLLHYNHTFLHHDEHTDVITFPVDSNNGVAGDVLMSYDRIKENADNFNVPVQHELRRVMVHGLLHLLGHKDKSKADRSAMRLREDTYLAHFPTPEKEKAATRK
ncbi:MAG: rRNA maturation RNase YbeY [Flavobacteriales bacterium]|jgi:rRNA maturation RNase YbeY|nr:rRNA maturation RNase YbeY [Flavobacteriales bacterium]MBK9626688.1 rRNA maturation RNase YbeY [Flavobacteriales bacterium]MBP8876708.1 rRNA maturation RNase YbeY [Flavobacteriales bacterium]